MTTETITEKLKINTTINKREEITLELDLPFYAKSGDKFFKVISKDLTVFVNAQESYKQVTASMSFVYYDEIAKGEAISEDDFLQAYNETFQYINSII
jgi:hypothetical protein